MNRPISFGVFRLCAPGMRHSYKFPVFFIITWFTGYCTTRFIKLRSVGQLIFSGFTPILLKQIIGKEFKCWPIYNAVWNFVRVLSVINNRLLNIYTLANKEMRYVTVLFDATITQVESRVNYCLQKKRFNKSIGYPPTLTRYWYFSPTLYHDSKIKITSTADQEFSQ